MSSIEEMSDDELKEELHRLNIQATAKHNNQQAIKILMNSLYGAVANEHFRYFDIRIAEGITLTGQLTIQWAEKAINKYLQKLLKDSKDRVIAADTDSLYIELKDLTKAAKPKNRIKFLSTVADEKLQPVFDEAYEKLFSLLQGNEQRMKMGREIIADRAIWTAKKRYIMNVWDDSGITYEEPKLKIMGIEAVKSSTPMMVRNKFKEAYKIILNYDEKTLQDFVAEFREDFKKSSPEEVAFPRGVSDIDKWTDAAAVYKKGTPIHVRGSLLYNKELEKRKLTKNYEAIANGSKIKFCYLKMPNTLRENVVSFPEFLPREFELHDYIDYDAQFEKTFEGPLQAVTDSVNWKTEKIETLEDFFG